MVEYSFFIDTESGTIGVAVDDGNTLSIDEYNSLADQEKPAVMELMQLLLNSFPETIDDFRERLVLVEDPEWDIREQLIFMRSDGGEDVIDHLFKADRAGVAVDAELLPGISYKQLFENTLNYHPAEDKKNSEVLVEESDSSFVVATPKKFSISNIVMLLKNNPLITIMLVIASITLVSGLVIFQSTPETIILAPDRLQQAAQVDQQLNDLKVNVDNLWNDLKGHMLLAQKDRRLYWEKLKLLNLKYRELRRSGFGHGNKFKMINATLKQIRDRLRPKKKKKGKGVKPKKKVKGVSPKEKSKVTVPKQAENKI